MKINKIFLYSLMAAGILSACQKTELYDVNEPAWIQSKIDSIAAEKAKASGSGQIEGLLEDVYTLGATDYSTGWWAQFSKYYQIPENQKLILQFNLHINPDAPNTYKNFALILSNDADRGTGDYKEYGAIRFDNQPSGNSEWGDYIDRSLVNSTLTFDTDVDKGIDKLGGAVTLTIDRTEGFSVTITNGTVTKTYIQKADVENLNADASNKTIRAYLVPEGSYIDFTGTTIEPIGGCTSKEDKQPLSMTLNGVPKKLLLGSTIEEAFANVTATIQFEQEVSSTVNVSDLTIQAVPDMNGLGTKTLIAAYGKTYKGEGAAKPVIASVQFDIVDKMYTLVGAADNSAAFFSVHSDNIKIPSGATFVTQFTNYTNGANNWNNFLIVLNGQDVSKEYAVVRADNYGWGNGYASCTPSCSQTDWAAWLKAMDGAKVTAYITNNGDGTADIKTVILGNDGNTYTQDYIGINTIDPDDCYFRLTVDGSHLEFDSVVGEDNNSTAFFAAHSANIQIPSGKTVTTRFTNYTSGANNWNNFLVVLNGQDVSKEYAVVRADNYGWGDGYASCTPSCSQTDWAAWLKAMDGAKVTLTITNHGDGTADIHAVILGNDGNTYTQDYIGLNSIEPDNCYFRVSVDGSHVAFE